jgi:hypothetical protein
MVFTSPDYGIASGQLQAPDVDLAELASRLGYPSVRRSGKVILFDPFTVEASGWVLITDAGGSISINTDTVNTGPGAVRMITGVGLNSFAEVARSSVMYPKDRRVSLELFYHPQTPLDFFWAKILFYTGTEVYDACLRFNLPLNKLEYATQVVPEVFNDTGITFPHSLYDGWHNLKFFIDNTTHSFVRIMHDSDDYLFSQPLPSSPVGTNPQLLISFNASSGVGSKTAFMDNVILTFDEY